MKFNSKKKTTYILLAYLFFVTNNVGASTGNTADMNNIRCSAEYQQIKNNEQFTLVFNKDYLVKWKKKWEDLALKEYLAFYSKNFYNYKNNYIQWKKNKISVFKTNARNINITLSDILILKSQKNKNIIKITFLQKYKSETYQSKRNKEQLWEKEDDGTWRIIYENFKSRFLCTNQNLPLPQPIVKSKKIDDYKNKILKAITLEKSDQEQAIEIYKTLISNTIGEKNIVARIRLTRLFFKKSYYLQAYKQLKIIELNSPAPYQVYAYYMLSIFYSSGYSSLPNKPKAMQYQEKYQKTLALIQTDKELSKIKISHFLNDINLTSAKRLQQQINRK